MCIGPKSPTNADTAARRYEKINAGWTFCEKESKSIEVSYKNDNGEMTLAKVHFRAQKTVRHIIYINSCYLCIFL